MSVTVVSELPPEPRPAACQAWNIVCKDGERFDVAYDPAKDAWAGTLSIPGLAPLTATAAVFWELLKALVDQRK
jgi:hypothetical protein